MIDKILSRPIQKSDGAKSNVQTVVAAIVLLEQLVTGTGTEYH